MSKFTGNFHSIELTFRLFPHKILESNIDQINKL